MAYSVLDFITDVMIDLGVLATGQTPNADESADILRRLNRLITSFNSQRDFVYTVQKDSLALTAGTASYTMGTAGTFSTTRPVVIKGAVAIKGGVSVSLKIWSDDEWREKRDRAASGIIPEGIWNDGDYPVSTIYVLPIPNASGCTMEIWSWKQLASYAALTDSVDLVPGYERLLATHLAIEIAPMFRRQVSQELLSAATAARQAISTLNLPPVDGAAQEANAAAQSAMAANPQQRAPSVQQQ